MRVSILVAVELNGQKHGCIVNESATSREISFTGRRKAGKEDVKVRKQFGVACEAVRGRKGGCVKFVLEQLAGFAQWLCVRFLPLPPLPFIIINNNSPPPS